jgi:hypothetical protein
MSPWIVAAAAIAAPKPHPDLFTADRLAGRWYEVGRPEQCEAGAHVFRHLRDPDYLRYENSAGLYAPSVGKLGVPDTGFGVLGELLINGEWRAFRFDHTAKGAAGQLVISPLSPTPEEKALKQQAWYDLVKCEGDWPESRRPAPGAPVSSVAQMDGVTLAWLVGSWGETGFDFEPSQGWFVTECQDEPRLAGGGSSPVIRGALTLTAVDGAAVTGWSTLWGVNGFFGEASPVKLALDGARFTAPDGDRLVIRRVDDDHMVWADEQGVAVYALERCR